MDFKYIDWRTIDLTKWIEANPFGPIDPIKKLPILRGSVHYNPPKIKLLEDGYVDLMIDYTDPKCPFRVEFTENPWKIRLAPGTEDIYSFVYRFPTTHKKENILTPKSLVQFYCRWETGGDIAFQLELTGKTQSSVSAALPLGSIQVVSPLNPAGKYRKATTVIPNGGDSVEVKIRFVHGIKGRIECELNGWNVYAVDCPTVFPADTNATAQLKIGIYDHMLNNETVVGVGEANRQKYLAAGVKNFSVALSPVNIVRRLVTEPPFGPWINDLVDPSRFVSNNAALTALRSEYDKVVLEKNQLTADILKLETLIKQIDATNADKAILISSLEAKLTTYTQAQSAIKTKIAEITPLLSV